MTWSTMFRIFEKIDFKPNIQKIFLLDRKYAVFFKSTRLSIYSSFLFRIFSGVFRKLNFMKISSFFRQPWKIIWLDFSVHNNLQNPLSASFVRKFSPFFQKFPNEIWHVQEFRKNWFSNRIFRKSSSWTVNTPYRKIQKKPSKKKLKSRSRRAD